MPRISLGFATGAIGLPAGVRTASQTGKLLIAVLAGQSNMEGIGDRENTIDTDYPGIYQFGGENGAPYFRQIDSDITPVFNNDSQLQPGNAGNTGTTSWLCPGEYMAREAIESSYADKVLLVPTARGSTPLCDESATDSWFPGDPGGTLFEHMIAQANLAIPAATGFADFAGLTPEIVLFWVQGEQDASDQVDRVTYRNTLESLIAGFRNRMTSASDARVVIGSMLPNIWRPEGNLYDPFAEEINRAQVEVSIADSHVFYAAGHDGAITTNVGRHYAPAAEVRTQGRRLGAILSPAAAGPAITSSSTVETDTGSPFALALTSDAFHATFAIVGGPDAAAFELTDPYHEPRLQWAGGGNGPAQDGDYRVNLVARDGTGLAGPVQTVTFTASTPVAPSAVEYVPASGSPYTATAQAGVTSFVQFDAVPLQAGVNIICTTLDTRYLTGVTVDGVAATKIVDSDANNAVDCCIWQIEVAQAGTFSIKATGNLSGFNCIASVGALVGAAAGPVDIAIKSSGSVANPAAASTALDVPAGGLGIALARCGGINIISWNSGSVIESRDIATPMHHSIASFAANSSSVPSFDCSGNAGQGLASAAWALA